MSTDSLLIRVAELFSLTGWVIGFWLCYTKTRRGYLLGAYIGTTLTWAFHYLFAIHLWHMEFAPGKIILVEWAGVGEAL